MVERIGPQGRSNHRWTAATFASFGAALGLTVLVDRLWLRRAPDASTIEQQGGSLSGRGRPGKGPSVDARDSGYETADANVRSLVIVMVSALVLMGGGLTTVFVMFSHFDRGFRAPNTIMTAVQRAPIDPPLPHLQADPYHDLNTVLMQQNQRLTTYGWNDPDHTSAHIPIERAMQQVVGKSLDATAQADAAGPPQTTQPFSEEPAVEALRQKNQPAYHMQGQGRANEVVPSYNPKDVKP